MMTTRLWIFRILILAAFILLLLRLIYLQLMRGEYYHGLAEGNRIRSISLEAPRGVVFDRNGKPLVRNDISFTVTVIPEEIKNHFDSLSRLAAVLHLDLKKILQELSEKPHDVEFLRLKEHLTFAEFADLSEILPAPGIYVFETPMRRTLHPMRDAHFLGYVGEVPEAELNARKSEGLQMGDIIGEDGIEKEYDWVLRGINGARELEVDAGGRLVRVLRDVSPAHGRDLYLTMDDTLQESAWVAVQTQIKRLRARNGMETPASVVALDPNSGEILAYVAFPSFDPNQFAQGISEKKYQRILHASFDPLLDRPIQAAYPSGSTFKMITGSAGLQERVISPEKPLYCPGYYHIPGMTFNCFIQSGHGSIKFTEAVAQSCDAYFYQVGDRLKIDRLDRYAGLFGIGQKTGIDLPGETEGLLPTPEWKKKVYKEEWYRAETINMSIGQGYLQITPLQLAVATEIVANGGTPWRPHFFGRTEDELQVHERLPKFPQGVQLDKLDSKALALVRDGMRAAVDHGTATAAKLSKVIVAGKTGTAENVPTALNPRGRNHAWFASFAPFEKPEIVVVVMMEQSGGYGGEFAAPIAKKVFEAYFKDRIKSEDKKRKERSG